jgi:hypothetical protein
MPSAFSITTSEYIIIRRRYASYTKRGFFVFSIIPGIVLEQRPILRTVSIIPGIDILAPERQDKRRGSLLSPNFIPIVSSVALRAAATSSLSPSGYLPPSAKYSVQVSVVIVKPAGTGIPIVHISARLAPLPPRRFFIVPSPSALFPPKQ